MRRFLTRWRLWLAAIAGFFIVLAGLGTISLDSAGDPFRKIKEGMSRDEVDRLLVGDTHIQYMSDDIRIYCKREPRLWGYPGETIIITFDEENKVHHVLSSCGDTPDKRAFWQRLDDEYLYQKSRLGW